MTVSKLGRVRLKGLRMLLGVTHREEPYTLGSSSQTMRHAKLSTTMEAYIMPAWERSGKAGRKAMDMLFGRQPPLCAISEI